MTMEAKLTLRVVAIVFICLIVFTYVSNLAVFCKNRTTFSTVEVKTSSRTIKFSQIKRMRNTIARLTEELDAFGVQRLPAHGWGGFEGGRAYSHSRCNISPILHQTWKTRDISPDLALNVRSWLSRIDNGRWKYRFWTDADNRHLIATRFPKFLNFYDKLPSSIMRADVVRYFILYEYGGVYADLDFELLQTLEKYMRKGGVVLGQEPLEHAHVLYHVPRVVCNALMLSCAGHPLWKRIIFDIVRDFTKKMRNGAGKIDVLETTGPLMLTRAIDNWNETRDVSVTEPRTFYPLFDEGNEEIRKKCASATLDERCRTWKSEGITDGRCARRRKMCESLRRVDFKNLAIGKDSIASHKWKHSWTPGGSFDMTEYDEVCRFSIDHVVKKPSSRNYTRQIERETDECIASLRSGVSKIHHASGRPGLHPSCDADREVFCADVVPGAGRTHACIEKHKSDLSEACRVAEYGS